MMLSGNSGNLPRNRLAGKHVPSGGTSVLTLFLGSFLNCQAVKLNRQAIYGVRPLFYCIFG